MQGTSDATNRCQTTQCLFAFIINLTTWCVKSSLTFLLNQNIKRKCLKQVRSHHFVNIVIFIKTSRRQLNIRKKGNASLTMHSTPFIYVYMLVNKMCCVHH